MSRSGIYLSTVVIGAFCLLVLPDLASAQVDLSKLSLPVLSSGSLLQVISRLLSKVLLVIGIMAFFYLLYAGYSYLSSGGDPTKASKAAGTIVNVVIGIILIAVSYVLLTFVIGQTKDLGSSNPIPTTSSTSNTQARPRSGSNTSTDTKQSTVSGGTTSSDSNLFEECQEGVSGSAGC